MKFSEKLIELRKQKGLSQEELGFKINVSRQTISKWEAEQTSPEVEKVKELSKVFDVSIEYLLNDEMENPKQKVKQFNKKKIGKIVLKIFLIIVAIYLIISLFKFIVLLKYSIKANKIADYNNYTISTDVSLNGNTMFFSDETYNKGIQILSHYEDRLEYITYINPEEKRAYHVTYSDETGKYYDYSEIIFDEHIYEQFKPITIRGLTKDYIPNTIIDIILCSLNPKLTVFFEDERLNIKYNQKVIETIVSINRETGIVDEVTTLGNKDYNDDYIYITHFDYIFDNDTIPGLADEPYIEGIDMIE